MAICAPQLGKVTRTHAVKLIRTILRGAVVAGARLDGVVLTGCDQTGVRWDLARTDRCTGLGAAVEGAMGD